MAGLYDIYIHGRHDWPANLLATVVMGVLSLLILSPGVVVEGKVFLPLTSSAAFWSGTSVLNMLRLGAIHGHHRPSYAWLV